MRSGTDVGGLESLWLLPKMPGGIQVWDVVILEHALFWARHLSETIKLQPIKTLRHDMFIASAMIGNWL